MTTIHIQDEMISSLGSLAGNQYIMNCARSTDLKMLTALVPEGIPPGWGTEPFHGL